MARRRKQTFGRKKIAMKLIEDAKARMVTLRKRRDGIFSKASELSTMCGAQMAFIVTSMAGKVHSLGSPDGYVNRNHRNIHNCPIENFSEAKMNDLYQKLNEVNQQLNQEESRAIILRQKVDDIRELFIEKHDRDDGLKKLLNSMMEFKEKMVLGARKITTASEASSSSQGGKEVIPSTTN
ncbi:agamous-like MADS-box protein AGL29 [Impatiens glandulifera]|uniref:agamous-like MADS-box protein AGL29 n=1 Tax=Impatiens glandulifera TaxID=253017 RepID=UPI001FB0D877|nr:agamous-like MADS-box protein AGL29 [Impatiens glandulifera]